MNKLKWKKASEFGFSFYIDAIIPGGETTYVEMPAVTPNKRGVNDIGFAYQEGIELYATLSEKPLDDNAIWQRINPFDEINKTVACIKIVNTSENAAKVNLRVILN